MKLTMVERDILESIAKTLEEKKKAPGLGDIGKEIVSKMLACIDERLNVKELQKISLPYDITLMKKLKELGLSQNQSIVFSALIYVNKGVTAMIISKALMLPRTETYTILNWLIDNGLIFTESWHDNSILHAGGYGRMYFVAKPEDCIINFIENKTNHLERLRDQVLGHMKK